MADRTGLRGLTTPRAAALAGVVFALLFAASVLLLRTAIPHQTFGDTGWVKQDEDRLRIALVLMPWAGIAFLWFVGVLRDQVGRLEDRFFSSLLLGSGLLFLAMTFVAMGLIGAIVLTADAHTPAPYEREVIGFAHAVILQISNIYALRMAAVFMIVSATIWLRTGVMPRWLAAVTYLLAVTLLVIVSLDLTVSLIFPVWVLVVSLLVLWSPSARLE